ncbi:unnamed protein product, partial [Mesorhabditis belari]|uniref:Uncharacterized protein n=1 Tax=Mesorhabditis belari TaxID=2138241 RepID=A0AAF3EBP0_9BILA
MGPIGLLATLVTLVFTVHSMRLDPERIAARLRIEEEIEEDRLKEAIRRDPTLARSRRQLATPKEIQIQVTAPLFSSRLFDYGQEAGDQEIPRSLDVGKKLDLHQSVKFYGENFKTVYILSNGGIGFESASRSYKTHIFLGGSKLIAPFWNRNDLRNGGHVWYREVISGRVLERGQSEIRYQYDKNVKMQPLGETVLPADNTNTFQAALFITDNETFANFIYSNVGWTQGAEAGFNNGDGSGLHFTLPSSGSENIMYLEEYGNTGIPGEWMFELGVNRVIRCKPGFKGDTCDQECSAGEWGADCDGCCHCAEGGCDAVNGGCKSGCGECWMGVACSTKKENCKSRNQATCALNALSYTEKDRCGEPISKCQCLAGFIGDGYKKCEDINECKEQGICHEKATCTNTPGRFFCQCNEGFTGDGVVSCSPALLYSSQSRNLLPKGKNTKMSFPLVPAMRLFGKLRNSITISSNGLIAVNDLPGNSQFFHLDDIGVSGIAPFYAPIDLTKSGSVTITEAKDQSILQKIAESISRAVEEPFEVESALIVSYKNVTDGKNKKGNTFQCVLTSGRLRSDSQATFAQLLYKDLSWSRGAEAGIVSPDPSNSISLPGSGTDGIELLTQLTNVKQPGVWLFRVDQEIVPGCVRSDQQPPYCEVEDQSHPPTLAALPPGRKISTQKATTTTTTTRSPTTTQTTRNEQRLLPGPRFIQPEIVKLSPISPKQPQVDEIRTSEITTHQPTTQKPRPAFNSTPHKPLVSISDADINEIPPDVFEVTFPPFVTVIPEIFTQRQKVQRPDFSLEVTENPIQHNKQFPTIPTITEVTRIPNQEENAIQPFPPRQNEGRFDLPVPQQPKEIKRITAEKPGTTDSAPIPKSITTSKSPSIDLRDRIVDMHLGRKSDEFPPSIVTGEPEEESQPLTTPNLPTTSSTSSIDLSLLFANRPGTSDTDKTNHFLVFTTKTPTRSSKVLKEASTVLSGRGKEGLVTAPPTVPDNPFKQHEAANAAASRMAVIIPASIVAAWLLILLCIVLFFFCKRRRSSERLHTLYGPSYSVRPVGGYNLKRNSQQIDGSSYEDHLDKAARISAEMNAYNQNGRVSLYGSYWNLQNTSPSGSHHSRQSPHLTAYQQPSRFAYTGRY